MTRDEFEEIQEIAGRLESAFNEFDQALRSTNLSLYERWKAYGKQVSNEYVSNGPCLEEVMESLESDISDEEQEYPEDATCKLETCNNPLQECAGCKNAIGIPA
jgi:hypothetical protein